MAKPAKLYSLSQYTNKSGHYFISLAKTFVQFPTESTTETANIAHLSIVISLLTGHTLPVSCDVGSHIYIEKLRS